MSAYIDKFRELKPAFKDSTDEELIPYLHEKYASDMPISEFYKKIGVEDPNAPGDISRGFSTGMEQLKQAGYGILAAGGATAEHALGEGGISTGIKKAGLAGYREQEAKIAETAKPSDEAIYSWEKAKEGDFGALADWMQYGIGQAGSQAVQALATAGLGGFVAKQGIKYAGKELAEKLVQSQAAKIAETEATKIAAGELTKEAIEQQATKMVAEKIGNIGATTALGGLAVTQEGGEIGGDLVAKAEKEGRPLTGDELAKAFGYSLGAGALEFVGDKFGLDVLTGKTKFGKTIGGMESIGGRVARGTVAGLTAAPVEAGTEYGQTLLEEAGKGNDPFSEQARKNAINAAAAGAFGGHVMGMAGGILTAPIAKATTVDDAIVNAEKALSEPTVNESQKLIPQLVFDKEGNSYDRNELLRNFIAQGNDEASANAYIDKITTPEIKAQPINLQTYRELQAKNAGILGIKQPTSEADIEAINERLAIQAENNAPLQPFDNSIPFGRQTRAEIADEWEQQDLAKELEKQQALPQDIEARKRLLGIQPVQSIQPVQPIKPIAETKTPTVQPKPVEFTPTHELNDGTPVVKVAGQTNVYADVSGNKREADDAVPIVAQKQVPAVENEKTIETDGNKQGQQKIALVNVPEHIEKAMSNDIAKQKRKVREASDEINKLANYEQSQANLNKKVEAERKLRDEETKLRKMRQNIFSAEDAAISAIDTEDGSHFSDYSELFPSAQKAINETQSETNRNPAPSQPAVEKPESADYQKTKIEPTTQQPRKGTVGGKLSAGEVVITSSGRQTTPFPKFQTKEGNTKPVHLKAVDKWLMKNAFEEAKARGDEFNARQFESNLDKPSQADKDSAEEYLFGEQPVVKKPILKPLIEEAPVAKAVDIVTDKKTGWQSIGKNNQGEELEEYKGKRRIVIAPHPSIERDNNNRNNNPRFKLDSELTEAAAIGETTDLAKPEPTQTPAIEKPLVKDQSKLEIKPAILATSKNSEEITKAQQDVLDALSAIGEAVGQNFRMNITPEQEQKLMPALTKLMDAAFRLGYYKFKDAAKFTLETIRKAFGDELADQINLQHLQGSYIGMSGKYIGQGADSFAQVGEFKSIEQIFKIEGDKNAVEKQETTQPNGSRGTQSGVREEGEDTTEGRAGIREGGQEEGNISEVTPNGWTKTSSGMMTNPDEKIGGIIDTTIGSGKWFFVSHNDSVKNQDNFDTWKDAYDALQLALKKSGIKETANDLVSLFNKLGKQGISKSGESLIKQRSNADIITAVQNYWLDVLADIGYEKESKSDNPNGKVFIQC